MWAPNAGRRVDWKGEEGTLQIDIEAKKQRDGHP